MVQGGREGCAQYHVGTFSFAGPATVKCKCSFAQLQLLMKLGGGMTRRHSYPNLLNPNRKLTTPTTVVPTLSSCWWWCHCLWPCCLCRSVVASFGDRFRRGVSPRQLYLSEYDDVSAWWAFMHSWTRVWVSVLQVLDDVDDDDVAFWLILFLATGNHQWSDSGPGFQVV